MNARCDPFNVFLLSLVAEQSLREVILLKMNLSTAIESGLWPSNKSGNITRSTDIYQLRVTLQRSLERNTTTPFASNIFIIVSHSCSSIFAAFVNLLVMIVLSRKEEFKTVANLVLKSMALSDLLVGLAVQPLTVVCHIFYIYGLESCKIKLVNSYLGIFCVGASMFSATMFSVDRCFATWFPFRYQEHVIYKKYVAIIVGGWIFLLFSVLITFLKILPKSFLSGFMKLFFYVCALAICFCYVMIYKEVRKKRQIIHVPPDIDQSNDIPASGNGGKDLVDETDKEFDSSLGANFDGCAIEIKAIPNIQRRKEREAIRSKQISRSYTVVMILSVFLLCYLPITLVKAFVENQVIPRQAQNAAFDWTNLIVLLNSSINPVIYCIRVQKIKAEMKKLLTF